MQVDGRELISFCSNDYLGLANHPEVKEAFITGVRQYGAGSGAAHLVNGHSRAHEELEVALAEFTGQPRALLFSTGYMANIGIAQAFADKGDTVLEDRLNHASLLDAGLLSGARFMRYAHNDAGDLQRRLAERDGHCLVMTDAVFSMDGDIAELPALASACTQHEAMLVIDDAHGIGVIGDHGRGSFSHHGIAQDANTVHMATLGKAMGTAGAFVAGSDDIIETLVQQARSYIYTTAQPAAVAVATLQSLKLIREDDTLQRRLHDNIAYFRRCATQAGLALQDSATAIQPVIIGDNEATLKASDALLDAGLLVIAIRPPTVPKGTARLRITLSASHERTHIDQLIEALTQALAPA